MTDARELAIEACESAFKDNVAKITAVFMNCLIDAKSDKGREGCRDRYKKGIQLSQEVLAASRAAVDEIFTSANSPNA